METIKKLSLRGQTPPKERSSDGSNKSPKPSPSNKDRINGEHRESISKEDIVASNIESPISSPDDEQPPSSLQAAHSSSTTDPIKGKDFIVKVKLLDEKQDPLEFPAPRDATGQWILDEVCTRLGGLKEKDYFGLTFNDKDSQWQWLELGRNAYKQLKQVTPCDLNFRVKHYPPSPSEDLKQDLSRYFLYLQVRMDLLKGRLLCDSEDTSQLAAYVLQSELGDYEDLDDNRTYLSNFKVVNKQSLKLEDKIKQKHSELQGITIREAEQDFLNLASRQETYGIYPFQVKNQDDGTIYLGLKHDGIVTFVGSKKAHNFPWSEILKMHCEGKHFIIHVTQNVETPYQRKGNKHSLHFRCENKRTAQAIWKWAIDRQCFFTLTKSDEARKVKSSTGIFKRSQTFRFSGRCQRELLNSSQIWKNEPQPVFVRVSSIRKDERQSKSLSMDAAQRYATFPRRHKMDSDDEDKHASNPALQASASGDIPNEEPTSVVDNEGDQTTAEVEVEIVTRTVNKAESGAPPTQSSSEDENQQMIQPEVNEMTASQDELSLNIIEEEDAEDLQTGSDDHGAIPQIVVTESGGQATTEMKDVDNESAIPLDDLKFSPESAADISAADNSNTEERISRELSSAINDMDTVLEDHENVKSKLPNGQPTNSTDVDDSCESASDSASRSSLSIAVIIAVSVIFTILGLILALETCAKSTLLQFSAIQEFNEHVYQPVRKGLIG